MFAHIIPKDKDIVVFGAFLGNRYGDNSSALFEYCNSRKEGIFKCYWLTDNINVVHAIRSNGVRSYLKKSIWGVSLSLRASLFITSHGINDVLFYDSIIGRTPELHLHHGIPFRGGELSKKGLIDTGLKYRRPKEITNMIATSVWGGERQRKNIPVDKSTILITGYPRNDIFFNNYNYELTNLKEKHNLNDYIILYAPTWRKWGKTEFFPFDDYDLNKLVLFLRQNNISIILRPHFVDMRRKEKDDFLNNISWCNDVLNILTIDEYENTQKLLLLSDCLITDYSSIYYDYLLLDRPIIFLPYDIKIYTSRMGMFLGNYDNETPGMKISTQIEFQNYIVGIINNENNFQDEREKMCKLVHKYIDGNSSERIFNKMQSIILKTKAM